MCRCQPGAISNQQRAGLHPASAWLYAPGPLAIGQWACGPAGLHQGGGFRRHRPACASGPGPSKPGAWQTSVAMCACSRFVIRPRPRPILAICALSRAGPNADKIQTPPGHGRRTPPFHSPALGLAPTPRRCPKPGLGGLAASLPAHSSTACAAAGPGESNYPAPPPLILHIPLHWARPRSKPAQAARHQGVHA